MWVWGALVVFFPPPWQFTIGTFSSSLEGRSKRYPKKPTGLWFPPPFFLTLTGTNLFSYPLWMLREFRNISLWPFFAIVHFIFFLFLFPFFFFRFFFSGRGLDYCFPPLTLGRPLVFPGTTLFSLFFFSTRPLVFPPNPFKRLSGWPAFPPFSGQSFSGPPSSQRVSVKTSGFQVPRRLFFYPLAYRGSAFTPPILFFSQ